MVVFTHLIYLERLYNKIHSKEYCFVEQSLCELEAKEAEVAKTGSIPTVVETTDTLEMVFLTDLVAHQLPLTDLFAFGSSFLLLPDFLFYNIL